MSSETKGARVMPATALRCRICETEFPLDPIGVCARCFGPLDPVYDRDAQRRTVTPRVDRGRAAVDLALRAAAAGRRARRAARSRRASRRSSPRRGSRRRSASASSGSSSTRRTRRTRSRIASSRSRAAKAIELGRTTLACSSTGNLANAVAARAAAEGLEAVVLCPGRPRAREAHRHRRSTARRIYRRRRQLRRLQPADASSSRSSSTGRSSTSQLRAYYAEGSKTLAFEIAEQLGWELPDAVVAPIASGAMFTKVHQGFGELLELGLVEGEHAAPLRRPGGRLLARRDRVRRRARR